MTKTMMRTRIKTKKKRRNFNGDYGVFGTIIIEQIIILVIIQRYNKNIKIRTERRKGRIS